MNRKAIELLLLDVERWLDGWYAHKTTGVYPVGEMEAVREYIAGRIVNLLSSSVGEAIGASIIKLVLEAMRHEEK